jgi:hypothetical protein
MAYFVIGLLYKYRSFDEKAKKYLNLYSKSCKFMHEKWESIYEIALILHCEGKDNEALPYLQ